MEENENKETEAINTQDNNIQIDGQLSIVDEKSEAIAHKDSALKRLDESFNKNIEISNFKRSNLLAYWIEDFSEYHDNEKIFKLTTLPTLKTFKRGDIIKVNLGFNVGDELGGLHYCVVLDKKDNPYAGTLNVIPLSSLKADKTYNFRTCLDLGDTLFVSLQQKYEKEKQFIDKKLSDLVNTELSDEQRTINIQNLLKKINYLDKIKEEIDRMKHGSIAYVNQITTVSKQRIFKTNILSGIKLSDTNLDLLDEKIKKLFTK